MFNPEKKQLTSKPVIEFQKEEQVDQQAEQKERYKDSIVLLGCGAFGKVHADNLKELGLLGLISDRDPSKGEIAKNLEVPFIESGEIEKIPKEILEKSKMFAIATNTPSHYPLMLEGLSKGKEIFVEKPPAETLGELEHILNLYPEAKVGVNYIEMAHPVVLATKENFGNKKPVYFLHHRAKDLRDVIDRGIGGGEGSRIILEDLTHDLSEILLFRGSLEGGKVTESKIKQWNEIGYSYTSDVEANFRVDFPEHKAEIKGSFARPSEVRQYVVVLGEDFEEAIYGNTLARPHISPLAARIKGKENVEYILEQVRNGTIIDEDSQKEVLERVGAELLLESMNKYVPESKYKNGKPMYGWAPLYNMYQNFIEAEIKGGERKKDLICSLKEAYDIQEIAEQAYKVAGKREAMKIEKI